LRCRFLSTLAVELYIDRRMVTASHTTNCYKNNCIKTNLNHF
jgi:hypothetical protein